MSTNISDQNLIQGKTGLWELVIGLEIHAQVQSESKLFSGAATAFGAEANTQVSFIDAGFPGMLPTVNKTCITQAIKTGLGFNGQINQFSMFDRKNYFYPDLPQGYQISQFYYPIVGEGYLKIELENGDEKTIGIERLHLEQDAGKSIHDQNSQKSYIDLNRSGVALMEIVTKPDIRSIEQAQSFIKKLRSLVRALGTCDGNMEQGNLRADVNISLRRPDEPFGTRAEIKNINSIRFMGQAITYEVNRQLNLLENGQSVLQETRLFDPVKGETRSLRSKEDAMDYRYFPDPDLPPLIISVTEIEQIKASLPELPDQKKERFINNFDLTPYDAGVLTNEYETADYYEKSVALSKCWQSEKNTKISKLVANWISGDLFALLNKNSLNLSNCNITPLHLAQLVDLIYQNIISGKIAKSVFIECFDSGLMPEEIIKRDGLHQVSDDTAIINIINNVIKAYPSQVAEYRSGKDKVFGFLVGMVMKAMQGKGNPQTINELLKKALNK